MIRVADTDLPHLDAGHGSHSHLLNSLAGIVINCPCFFCGPPSILQAPPSIHLTKLVAAIHVFNTLFALCVWFLQQRMQHADQAGFATTRNG